MRRSWSVLILLSVFGTCAAGPCASTADEGPIAHRKQILKHYGEVTKPVVSMIKRQQDYDPRLVSAALKTYLDGTKLLPGLFPPDTKSGGETQAKPAIWDDKARFETLFAKFGDTCDAASRTITDEASFRATMPGVLGACKGCHDEYREKK